MTGLAPDLQQAYEKWQQSKTMPFGKHNGSTLRNIFDTDRQYLAWCLQQN
jgi:uncharacterized protein (DUF3820 family)